MFSSSIGWRARLVPQFPPERGPAGVLDASNGRDGLPVFNTALKLRWTDDRTQSNRPASLPASARRLPSVSAHNSVECKRFGN